MPWPEIICSLAFLVNGASDTVSFARTSPPVGSRAEGWFALHTFVGGDGCLAVHEGQRLEQGDPVLVFEAGKPERAGRVSYVFNADSAKRIFRERGFNSVYSDTGLWNRIGCYWGFKGDPPPLIARYEGSDIDAEGSPLAIQGLPPSAQVLGGNGSSLGPSELDALDAQLAPSLPKAFAGGKVLRFGRRYGSGRGRELIEVFLGIPTYNTAGTGPQIDSIQVCRLFLHNGRVLALQRFSRASGREEHVDLEPPQLDKSNWFLTSEETLGYLSLDGGATWVRLSIDVGFEGINWAISRLEGSMPQVWSSYLYTPH